MWNQRQRVVDSGMGDCFAACMASLLELPIEVMPNDHSSTWWTTWYNFLAQFGLEINYSGAKGAIWASHPWIASVKSKNYKDGTHAIVMHNGGQVLFDPSTKKRHRKGTYLGGKGIVVGGYRITVSDFSKLHLLEKYRQKLSKKKP